jgi:hypothetical protein
MQLDPRVLEYVLATIDDDHGISEKGYRALCVVLQGTPATELLWYVNAVDGRFFVPGHRLPAFRLAIRDLKKTMSLMPP